MSVGAVALLVVGSLSSAAAFGEVIWEARGVLTEQTPGVSFGTHDWKGYGKPCPLVKKPYADTATGCWSVKRVKLPNKAEGKGAYFKFSYDAKYAYVPCYSWLFASGLPWQYYSRDYVHSGELGKQVIGRILLSYFTSGK